MTQDSGAPAADEILEAHGGLRTELGDWFPLAEKTGVPVPRTTILPANGRDLFALFDVVTEPSVEALARQVVAAAEGYGFPAFVRTGLLSAKHNWKWVPQLTRADDVMRTLYGLTEMQEMVWLPPIESIIVREMLPTTPLFHAFEDMPITLERRYFIDGGKVVDRQAYWPISAIEGHVVGEGPLVGPAGDKADLIEVNRGDDDGPADGPRDEAGSGRPLVADWRERLIEASRESKEEIELLTGYAERLAAVMPGAWSVDFLSTKRGWFFIDAAWAETSYVVTDEDRAALGMPLRPEGLPSAA